MGHRTQTTSSSPAFPPFASSQAIVRPCAIRRLGYSRPAAGGARAGASTARSGPPIAHGLDEVREGAVPGRVSVEESGRPSFGRGAHCHAATPAKSHELWSFGIGRDRLVLALRAQGTNAIAYIFDAHFPIWVTDTFLVTVCIAIFVCCLAIQAATSRLLFAFGRDKMIPASKFFGYVHPSAKAPLASAVFVAVAAIAVLLYVNLGGSDPFIAIARVTAWATAGTYIAYQMVVLGGLIARGRGWPKDRAYFNLGKWGRPVNILALVYGVFMIINLVWPRTPDAGGTTATSSSSPRRRGRRRRHHLADPEGPRCRPQRDHPRDRRVAGRGRRRWRPWPLARRARSCRAA